MRRFTTAMSLAAALALVGTTTLVPSLASASGGGGCGGPVTESAGTQVAIRNFCFEPTILRVESGQEVTFANRDVTSHNVLGANGIWGGYDALRRHRESAYRFTEPGVYPYVCVFHPGMVGAIVVGDGVGSGFETTTEAGPVAQVTPPDFERVANVLPADEERERDFWTFVAIAAAATFLVAAVVMRRRRRATT
jgi:plastocyanin